MTRRFFLASAGVWIPSGPPPKEPRGQKKMRLYIATVGWMIGSEINIGSFVDALEGPQGMEADVIGFLKKEYAGCEVFSFKLNPVSDDLLEKVWSGRRRTF